MRSKEANDMLRDDDSKLMVVNIWRKISCECTRVVSVIYVAHAVQ